MTIDRIIDRHAGSEHQRLEDAALELIRTICPTFNGDAAAALERIQREWHWVSFTANKRMRWALEEKGDRCD